MFPVKKKISFLDPRFSYLHIVSYCGHPCVCAPHHFCPFISLLFIISPSMCPSYMHAASSQSARLFPPRVCRICELSSPSRADFAPCRLRANPATTCRNTSRRRPSLPSSTRASCKSLHPPAAPSTTSVSRPARPLARSAGKMASQTAGRRCGAQ